jgi:hypothetical protein
MTVLQVHLDVCDVQQVCSSGCSEWIGEFPIKVRKEYCSLKLFLPTLPFPNLIQLISGLLIGVISEIKCAGKGHSPTFHVQQKG